VIQHDSQRDDPSLSERLHCEQGVVDAAEGRTTDHHRGQPKPHDEIPNRDLWADRHHDASHAFHHNHRMTSRKGLVRSDNPIDLDDGAGKASSRQRGQRSREAIGSDDFDRI